MAMPRSTAVVVALVLAGLLLVPALGSNYLVDLSTEILIYMLFALSLNVLIGYSGNVSFGHAAYFAIGGYTCAILLTTYEWPLLLAFPAAVLLSGLAAAFVGYFCDMTGGDDGFVGVTVPALIDGRVPYFYFTLVVVSISIALLWVICHSAFGRTLVAVRENRTRAGFVGVNTRAMRHVAFVVAGTFAGIAGALLAMYNHGMYVESAFWTESAQVLIMTLLGGMYSFFGPAMGAALLYLLNVFTIQYTEYWPTVQGVILLIILLFVPEGVVGLGQKIRQQLAKAG